MAEHSRTLAGDATTELEVAALMGRYNRRLFRVAWSILRDETAAEDAVQETYVQYFRKRSSFRGDSDLGTWLTRIVINQALMEKRRKKPAVPLDNLSPSAEILLHPSLVSSEDPEKLAARREMRVLIEAAVAELPEAFRLAFVLREIEDSIPRKPPLFWRSLPRHFGRGCIGRSNGCGLNLTRSSPRS